MADVNAIDQVLDSIKGAIARSVAPLIARIESLDAKLLAAEEQIKAIPVGRDGANGSDGKDGRDGVDAPDLDAIVNAVEPILHAAVSAIEIPKGEKGDPGLPGEKGADAEPVDVDAIVQKIVSLVPVAKDGRDGIDGKPGIDGANGRDALEIQILPSIDEAKSYPRGTVAIYKGGMIRANRRTDAITNGAGSAGWEVMCRGIDTTEIIPSDDMRTLTVRAHHTDGHVSESTIKSPAIIYREIYTDGVAYEKGDAVTFGGSLWIAKTDTTDRPGDGVSWKLAVKRGRDGKDLSK